MFTALCNIDGSILERVLYTDIVSRIFFSLFVRFVGCCWFVRTLYHPHPHRIQRTNARCVFGGGIILHETYERAIPTELL